MPKAIVLEFETERETKNAYRYRELPSDNGECIGVLYVKKTCIRQIDALRNLKITIEDAGR